MSKGYREPGEKPHRFYKTAEAVSAPGGFTVHLDGRALRTPKGAPLVVPSEPAARQIAEEWAAQGEFIEIAGMHAARLAHTAIDAVAQAREATAQSVADYAASDLLCYYAEAPAALAERQTERWGPVLDRAELEEGLVFIRAAGIVHRDQPAATLGRVKDIALSLDDLALAGLAFGTSLYGSAVLAIAVQRGWLSGAEAYHLSRLDEAWQEEQWGIDDEAAERTARLTHEAEVLGRWFANLSGG